MMNHCVLEKPSIYISHSLFRPKDNDQKPRSFGLQGTNDTSHEAHAKRVRDFYASMLVLWNFGRREDELNWSIYSM